MKCVPMYVCSTYSATDLYIIGALSYYLSIGLLNVFYIQYVEDAIDNLTCRSTAQMPNKLVGTSGSVPTVCPVWRQSHNGRSMNGGADNIHAEIGAVLLFVSRVLYRLVSLTDRLSWVSLKKSWRYHV